MPSGKAIGIIGYGRMGKVLEKVLSAAGFQPVIIHDNRSVPPAISESVTGWIDFSEAAALPASLTLALETRKPLVIGTTGWYDHLDPIAGQVHQAQGKVLWGANFDLTMQLTFVLTDVAARLLRNSPLQPRFHIHEIHHTGKKDAPSGTALHLARMVQCHFPEYRQVEVNEGPPAPPHTNGPALPITYRRQEGVFGIHELTIHTGEDTIRLSHTAHGREGFARGALAAFLWLAEQPPGFYSIDDYIGHTWLTPAGLSNA